MASNDNLKTRREGEEEKKNDENKTYKIRQTSNTPMQKNANEELC